MLSENEKKVLLALRKLKDASPVQLMSYCGFTELVEVMSASSWLRAKNLVEIEEYLTTWYSLDREGEKYLSAGLPESRILDKLKDGKISIPQLLASKDLSKLETNVGIGYLKELGAVVKGGEVIIKDPDKISKEIKAREGFLRNLKEEKEKSELDKDLLAHLAHRKHVLKKRHAVTRRIRLTDKGSATVEKGIRLEEEELGELTSELIQSGRWRKRRFRKYDLSTYAPKIYPGKEHPLTTIIKKIRKIFLQMGFKEIEYDWVQPCFWNMDALFVPQDHPVRDLQDSFYVARGAKIDEKIVNKIKQLHEKFWRGKWELKEAEREVLRTQTTVNSIRYLAEHKEYPIKVFTIGRNFRREKMNSTHLPEFIQIEGILGERGANFQMLIGILREFYRRIGFKEIKIKPSYFPFTEPSLEVAVEWHGKTFELGGAGVFRPEIMEALGVKHPVLAWGLGLERLAMLKLGLNDIRELYISDIGWLRKTSTNIYF